MNDDKKLTIRVSKDVWGKANLNAKLKGFRTLQEFLRHSIVQLNEWAEQYQKSKAVVEEREKG